MRYPALLTLLIAAAGAPVVLLCAHVAWSAPARQAAPPGFLARLPPPLNTAPWRELGRVRKAPGMDLEPEAGGEVSPDGRYALQTFPLSGTTRQYNGPIVIDLTTGQTRIVTLDGDTLLSRDAYWDPLDAAFIYAQGLRFPKDVDIYRETTKGEDGVWRVRVDGTHVQRFNREGERAFLPSPPMPDGRVFLSIYGEPGAYVLQMGSDTTSRHPVDWTAPGLDTASPNGALLAGGACFAWHLEKPGEPGLAMSPEFARENISVYEIETKRRAVLFTTGQVTLGFPKGSEVNHPAFSWLPDSSGFLLSLPWVPPGKLLDDEQWQLWKLSLTGELQRLADGVAIRGWSANGRHWIFNEGKKHYLVSVPAGAVAKPPRQGDKP